MMKLIQVMSEDDLSYQTILTNQWSELLTDYGSPNVIWVAVSGGRDSMVLLHWLRFQSGWPFERIKVIHVDHQLHASSREWASHVRAVCREWSIEGVIETVNVERQGKGLEAAAREARYRVYHNHIGPCDWLALGHHRGDRVESLLLNLLRGAGPRGLSSMRVYRIYEQLRVVRPLLPLTQDDLKNYSIQHQLCWVEDPSNQDDVYDRNFVRLNLLPLIEKRWPAAQRAIASSARWLQEADDYQERHSLSNLDRVLVGKAIDMNRLIDFPQPDQKQIIRCWLRHHTGFAPGQKWLQTFFKSVLGAAVDAQPKLFWMGGFVRRHRQYVYWCVDGTQWHGLDERVEWKDPNETLDMPGWGTCLACDINDPSGEMSGISELTSFFVGPVSGGTRFHPSYRHRATTVKKCLQELDVPPWERLGCLGVFQQECLVAMILTDGQSIASRDCPFVFRTDPPMGTEIW